MDQFEKFENQLLSSYITTLAEESRKICKELENKNILNNNFIKIKNKNYGDNILIFGTDLFDIIKAMSYLKYYLEKDITDEDFYIKCMKPNYDITNFKQIKNNLNSLSETREKQKDKISKTRERQKDKISEEIESQKDIK